MTVNITDFIGGNRCTAGEINKACFSLSDGDTLSLKGMRLDIWPEGAFKKHYTVIEYGCADKPIAFPILNKKNIIIDGEGAELIFHGELMPFAVDESENILIKNLSIDYNVPFFAEADIIEADEHRVLLKYTGKGVSCSIDENNAIRYKCEEDGWEKIARSGLLVEFEGKTKMISATKPYYILSTATVPAGGFLDGVTRYLTPKQLGENLIEFTGEFGFTHTVGNKIATCISSRALPGFLITYSKDIILSDINLYHAPAYGVFNVANENVTLKKVIIDVRKGSDRLMSVNSDGVHFANCRGKINVEDCRFVRMLDDTLNIHGTYLNNVTKVDDFNFTAGFKRFPFYGAKILRKGDKIQLLDTESINQIAVLTVKDYVFLEGGKVMKITTEEPLPEITGELVAENLMTAPEISIKNTESGNNRPRGFLLTSAGKTVVENCTFYNMSQGIHIGGEMINWFESGAVKDVTIRNNYFNNAAFCGGYPIHIFPKIKDRERVGSFHGSIRVENNKFRMCEKRFITAYNVKNLIYKNNVFIEDKTLPSHPVKNETGIVVAMCENVSVEECSG